MSAKIKRNPLIILLIYTLCAGTISAASSNDICPNGIGTKFDGF